MENMTIHRGQIAWLRALVLNMCNTRLLLLIPFLALFPSLLGYSADKNELESLKALKGLSVLVEGLPFGVEERGQLTSAQIQTDVELKLRLAGIKVIPKEELFGVPGSPCLYINVNILRKNTGLTAFAVRAELSQQVTLRRNPKTQVWATTWTRGEVGTVGEGKLQQIRDSIKDVIDEFINDYLSVNVPMGK